MATPASSRGVVAHRGGSISAHIGSRTRERPEARSPVAGGAMLMLPIAAVVVALRGYLWWEQGELLALAALGDLVAAGLGLLAFGA